MTVEVRPYRSEDYEQVAAIRREAFRGPTDDAGWRDGGWVLEDAGRIQAIVLVERAGQFFGGRAVSCAQVRSVAVVPWARGRGFGVRILTEVLTALQRDGIALSSLFPTIPAPYSRVGYGVAGSRTQYRWAISTLPRAEYPSVEPFESSVLEEVRECYRQYAAGHNGLLDRTDLWWKRLLAGGDDQPVHGAVVRTGTRVSGYTLYTQERHRGRALDLTPSPLASLGLAYSVNCRDLVWTDQASARALVGYLAGNAGLGMDWLWYGPVPEPLTMMAGRQDAIAVQSTMVWMSRLIDVQSALRARGYPCTLNGSIELGIADSTLPSNAGCLHLEWREGKLRIDPAPRAAVRLDVEALAPIFTGRLPARDAVRLGLIGGATERDIAMLEAAFLGPSPPWLIDVF
jgi:predicted acetyltransferase